MSAQRATSAHSSGHLPTACLFDNSELAGRCELPQGRSCLSKVSCQERMFLEKEREYAMTAVCYERQE